MTDDLEIPVAFCTTCDADVPVYIAEFEVSGTNLELVLCPKCESIMSMEDLKVTFYSAQDVEKVTGWRVADAADTNE